jgi:hypothetical protein
MPEWLRALKYNEAPRRNRRGILAKASKESWPKGPGFSRKNKYAFIVPNIFGAGVCPG